MNQHGNVPAKEVRAYINRWSIGWLALVIAFPLTTLGIYCAGLPSGGLMAYGAAATVSAASCISGGLLGFLFGIPRALSGDAEISLDEQHNQLLTNTNLEQISDWLTKIIVGATLVQLGPLARRFGELAKFVSGVFGSSSAQHTAMAGGIILYSAVLGFFATYVGTRSIITFIFSLSPSYWISEQQHIQTKQGTGDGEKSLVEHPDLNRSNDP